MNVKFDGIVYETHSDEQNVKIFVAIKQFFTGDCR